MPISARCAVATLLAPFIVTTATAADFPTFRPQEIDHTLKIGYAVKIVDLNADARPDIVVVDKHRVIWFENPGKPEAPWKLHTMLDATTQPDNVCLDVLDIDGDGKLDLALGAGWQQSTVGTIQWLKQGADIDQPWKLYPIGEEPSVHRMRFVEMKPGERPTLVVAPLQGKGATAKNNWAEKGPRILAYKIPADPAQGPWTPDVLTDELHVVHNFIPVSLNDSGVTIAFASYEGLFLWTKGALTQIGIGNQETPTKSRGCSEVKVGRLKDGSQFFATIEPWHGNQVVVYTPPKNKGPMYERHVIDTELKWGHGVWCCDLDGDGNDEIVIGVRDPLTERVKSGVNAFKATTPDGTAWEKHVIDNGGVATEDLACADLDGDGRIDIVAVGRATGNVKVYWNGAK